MLRAPRVSTFHAGGGGGMFLQGERATVIPKAKECGVGRVKFIPPPMFRLLERISQIPKLLQGLVIPFIKFPACQLPPRMPRRRTKPEARPRRGKANMRA